MTKNSVNRRPNMTKSERLALERLRKKTRELHDGGDYVFDVRHDVPDAWRTLEEDFDVEEPKTKITLRLDASVAKFYRAMGKGYQERINQILASYAHMRIAGILEREARLKEEYPDAF